MTPGFVGVWLPFGPAVHPSAPDHTSSWADGSLGDVMLCAGVECAGGGGGGHGGGRPPPSPGQKEWGGPRGNWAWGKGRARGDNRTGQTALAKNGAEGGDGRDKRERIIVVVRSPCQEHYPADAHPSAHKSVLESANPRIDSECASDRATAPSPGRPTPGVVKQDKSSGGSIDTTKTRSGPRRVRMCTGERPIGAAKGRQPHTEALCQPPPPLSVSSHECTKSGSATHNTAMPCRLVTRTPTCSHFPRPSFLRRPLLR